MNQNMALLSQTEIDTLLNFLQKSKVGEEVMDQSSIDRLINLLQTDQKREFKYSTNVPQMPGGEGQPLLLVDGMKNAKEQERCVWFWIASVLALCPTLRCTATKEPIPWDVLPRRCRRWNCLI